MKNEEEKRFDLATLRFLLEAVERRAETERQRKVSAKPENTRYAAGRHHCALDVVVYLRALIEQEETKK